MEFKHNRYGIMCKHEENPITAEFQLTFCTLIQAACYVRMAEGMRYALLALDPLDDVGMCSYFVWDRQNHKRYSHEETEAIVHEMLAAKKQHKPAGDDAPDYLSSPLKGF